MTEHCSRFSFLKPHTIEAIPPKRLDQLAFDPGLAKSEDVPVSKADPRRVAEHDLFGSSIEGESP
jgi:hypothetical protein